MATLSVPYSFNPNTPIVASEMNSNFAAVKAFVEALSTGTNIDSAAITTDKLATNTIQLLTPTGSIVQYGGSVAPTGWHLCDGTALSQTTYSALFAVIGGTYNTSGGQAAPSAGTFRVPILSGRVPVGKAVAGTFSTLGGSGGAETHTLTANQSGLPAHQHANTATFTGNSQTTGNDSPDHAHLQRSGASLDVVLGANTGLAFNHAPGSTPLDSNMYTGGATARHQHSFTSAGTVTVNNVQNAAANAAEAHNILQPYIVVNFIIKL
jgi:microcystin-dependent protein